MSPNYQKLLELGPVKFAKWVLDEKPLLFTDTTFRDAHQSLMATRMRSYDMLACAGALHSPKILMLSGIGPADHLKSVGVEVKHDLPGVGRNFQDHIDVYVISELNELNRSRPGTDLGTLLNDQRTLRESLEDVTVLYVPVYSTGCVFQGVQRQDEVRKGGK